MEQRVRHYKEASANFSHGALLKRESSKQTAICRKFSKKKPTTLRGLILSRYLLLIILLGLVLLAPQLSTSPVKHRKFTVQISRKHARLRQQSKFFSESNSRMVTVVMTGCDAAAAWQSLGLYYSFLR